MTEAEEAHGEMDADAAVREAVRRVDGVAVVEGEGGDEGVRRQVTNLRGVESRLEQGIASLIVNG